MMVVIDVNVKLTVSCHFTISIMTSSLIGTGKCICNAIKLAAARASRIAKKSFDHPVYRHYSVTHRANPKMADRTLPQVFKYVDDNAETFKQLLKEAVGIPSVSSDIKYRNDCVRMAEWMQEKLKEVGATTELRDVGYQTIDGKEVKLPPVLVGVLGNVSIFLTKILL